MTAGSRTAVPACEPVAAPEGDPAAVPARDPAAAAAGGAAVVLDRSVQRLEPGLLLGGMPLRVVRLAPAAVAALDALLAAPGARTEPAGRAAELVRARLCRSGLLHPLPPPWPPVPGLVTVVIPARGRRALVRRAL
ncbi:MAG TPA: hypothetical protein VMD59_22000, partial [Acidimicrobiales bacterium]|nr:hypothetical protein [Acidimicrobiales bacterium]